MRWTVALCLCLGVWGRPCSASSSCAGTVIEVPPPPNAPADSFLFAFDTRRIGETFYADRTELRAISVWRTLAWDISECATQIVIMPVDSTGKPVMEILVWGPTVAHGPGDGVHPVEFKFVFDPPVELPHPGQYFFALGFPDCFCAMYLITDTHNPYPQGQPWYIFGNRYACGVPMHPSLDWPNWDMAFRVELCDPTTPTKRRSWGELKLLYR